MRLSAILVISLLGLSLVGCGKSDPNAVITDTSRKETATKDGWTEISTAGLALSFPKGWKAIDLTQGNMSKSQDAVFGNDPKFASMKAQVDAMSKQGLFKLFVFETDVPGAEGAGTNCNVTVTPGAGAGTLEASAEAGKAEIAKMTTGAPEITYVDLPAGRAAMIVSKIKAPNMNKTMSSRVYMLKHDNDLVGITFTCPEEEDSKIEGIAKDVMQSFHFAG